MTKLIIHFISGRRAEIETSESCEDIQETLMKAEWDFPLRIDTRFFDLKKIEMIEIK